MKTSVFNTASGTFWMVRLSDMDTLFPEITGRVRPYLPLPIERRASLIRTALAARSDKMAPTSEFAFEAE